MEEGFIQSFINKIMDGVRTSLIELSQSFDIEKALPLELTRQQVAKMLGCSPNTFDERFRYAPGFPVCSNGKFPRDDVRSWYNQHWKEI